jgi:hypothetical protein
MIVPPPSTFVTPWCLKFIKTILNIQLLPHRKHTVPPLKNQLMLFREIITVYCQDLMLRVNILCGQNIKFLNVRANGM